MTSSLPAKRLIGIFGGTFDPVHQGHLACARYVLTHCDLDALQLMPCHLPPHRASPGVSAIQRVEMLKLAITGEPKMQLQTLELQRHTPSYTADSLALLKHAMPDTTLAFVIGMDSLAYFKQWHQWQHILTLSHLIVCRRPGYSSEKGDTPTLLAKYGADISALRTADNGKIIMLNNPEFSASATAIRHALAQKKQNITELSPAVLNYIQQQQLYQS
jgi:nicotinate-nucleotide adenylyltransferase